MTESRSTNDPHARPRDAGIPDFTVRHSPRARRARISVTPHDGVVVVLPPGLDLDVAEVVRERREWIAAATAELAERRAAFTADPRSLLPDTIDFRLTGECWSVRYRATASSTVRAVERSGILHVTGDVATAEKCLAALQRWLLRAARSRLLPLLHTEAARVGLRYANASVRGQRDRWGGCTPAGHITLNRALVFLEVPIVEAVMRHELAHLVHPDHSRAFWASLAQLDPEYSMNKRLILSSRDAVPAWAERRARRG